MIPWFSVLREEVGAPANVLPRRCLLLSVKLETQTKIGLLCIGRERLWYHIDSSSCWILETKKQVQHCTFFHTLFGAADEADAIRRRIQRGCMTCVGSNNCAFWCYSLLFIPLSFCYLARDYRVQMNIWWNSRESKFCRTIHTDKSSSQKLSEVACSPLEGSQNLNH